MTDPAHLRRIQQLVAPVVRGPGALADDLDDLALVAVMLDMFDDTGTGRSRTELLDPLRTGDDGADHHLELLFDRLVELEWLVQVRAKAGTQRWRPCALALTSVELLSSLAERTAADRLVELIVLALDRLDNEDLTQNDAADITRQLTRNISLVAADLEAALAHGTLRSMRDAMPSRRALAQVERVRRLFERARPAFPQLAGQLLGLLDAASRLRDAAHGIGAALTELVRSGEVDSPFAVLDPEAVLTACDLPVERLAAAAARTPWPALPVVVDPAAVTAAAEELGTTRVPQRPQVPPAAGAVQPRQLLDQARHREEAEADRRRRWTERTVAGQAAAIVDIDVWPAPVERLVDGLAVSADRTLPVIMEAQQHHDIRPHPSVAATAPLRLRRLDPPDVNSAAGSEHAAADGRREGR